MDFIEIPLRKDIFDYTEKITLEGVIYTLGIRYNARMDRWLLSIKDSADTNMAISLPLLNGVPLTYKWVGRIAGFPPGQFTMVDETDQDRSPGKDDLGDDLKLIYLEAA
jgi:hypothetical protein